jgi:anti-sigma regulatory factor (Ser/Thr protein kinase)
MARARRTFEPIPSSVPAARRFVTDTLDRWALGQLCDWGALAVSELATNAVVHAATPFEVELEVNGEVVITVTDRSLGVPVARSGPLEGESGRGVHLIEALSDRWGVQVGDSAKRVWCSVARPR